MWIGIDADDPDNLCRPHRPSLPSSLKHIVLQVYEPWGYSMLWYDCFDWRFLNVCTNLQKLTLPDREQFTWPAALQLQTWVRAARHLHIVDFFPVDYFLDMTDWVNAG